MKPTYALLHVSRCVAGIAACGVSLLSPHRLAWRAGRRGPGMVKAPESNHHR